MAIRSPLILNAGVHQQLPTGDRLSIGVKGQIEGLITSNNATDSNNDIDFGVGEVEINGLLIQFGSVLTKRLDAAWTAGNNQGMLATGSKAANTTYHLFAIYNSTTGVADYLADTSLSAANRPSGYEATLIWSIMTNGSSNIHQYTQNGNKCVWKSPTDDVSVSSISDTSGTLYALKVPSGIAVEAQIRAAFFGSSANWVDLNDPTVTDSDISGNATVSLQAADIGPYLTFSIGTNTSRQIRARANTVSATETLTIKTLGFTHSRWGGGFATVANGSRPNVSVTGSKTLGNSDRDTCQLCNSGSAIALLVPADSTINPLGIAAEIDICRYGSGSVTINADTGVNIRNINGNTTGHVITTRYGFAVLKWVAANEWVLGGLIN